MRRRSAEQVRRVELPPPSPVTLRRTSAATSSTTCERTRTSSPASPPSQVFVRDYPNGTLGRAHPRLRRRGRRRAAEGAALTRASSRATGSAATGSRSHTTSFLRGRTAPIRVQVDASGEPQRAGSSSRDRAGRRRQPEADDRLGGAGGRRGGARELRPAGRLRGDGRRTTATILGDGLLPDLRPERLHAAGRDQASSRRSTDERGRAAARPRDPGRLPDRLDLQADHRDRRRSKRACSTPPRRSSTTRLVRLGGGLRWTNAGDSANGVVDLVRGPAGLLRRLLLRLGLRRPARDETGRRPSRTGPRSSGSARRPASTCPARREGLLPTPEWRNQLYGRRPGSCGGRASRRLLETDRPGRSATTSARASGRATCRPTRCRWRRLRGDRQRRHRRAPAPRRGRSRTRRARPSQEFEPAAAAPGRHLGRVARGDPGRPARRGQDAGGTSYPTSSAASRSRSPARPAPRSGRQDGHQSWYVALAPYPDPEYRHRRHDRGRRLRRRDGGARRAARSSRPTSASARRRRRRRRRLRLRRRPSRPRLWFQRAKVHSDGDGNSHPRPVAILRGRAQRRPRPADRLPPHRPGHRARGDRADRLSASSLLGLTTQGTTAAIPTTTSIRQSIYAVIGVAAMFALARVDYSRFRELRVGIYGTLIFASSLVLVLGFAARGSRRWIELPFFTFQPSELGQAPARPRAGRLRHRPGPALESEWQRTVRLLLLGACPRLDRFPAARPGHRARLRRDHARGDVRGRDPLDALRGHRRSRAGSGHSWPGGRPGGRRPGPQGLPGRAS